MGYTYTDELYHFGVKGMKWGIRRFFYVDKKDGTVGSFSPGEDFERFADLMSG